VETTFTAPFIGDQLNRARSVPIGGIEADLRSNAAIDEDDVGAPLYDPDRNFVKKRREAQKVAFEPFKAREYREKLQLSNWHPQCLFERMKSSDSTFDLAELPEAVQSCLRHAARWAAALRAQEFCNEMARAHGKGAPLGADSGFACDPVTRRLSLYPTTKSRDLDRCELDKDERMKKLIEEGRANFQKNFTTANPAIGFSCIDLNELKHTDEAASPKIAGR